MFAFSKLSAVFTAVLVTLAAAAPSAPTSRQCCTSVQDSSSLAVTEVAALLGLSLGGLNVPVGLGCSPITVVGNNCGGQEVTCSAPKEQYGTLIAINCIPITL
ncbi:fungal hydrophobin [Mycena belliarum]|uniref:Hydrophobin n=1 Tax=Mycena belliarum TaxID=1033014 RepID=A0AAD6TQI0_9AGAR|nr:fungal hydrophobin [Mycena belliae]KAJ7082451.1 fungal hydrophobin [Mycena belliae]